MPFEELPHTADWSLRVWAANLNQLLSESARGMNALTGVRLAENPRVRRTFTASAPDVENLLVSFLSELVYFADVDRLAFDHFDIHLDMEAGQPFRLSATLHGAPILSSDKAIKAVTFHNLQIQQTPLGVEVEMVFDV